MVVYVVMYGRWDESYVDSIWSTPEQAEEAIKKLTPTQAPYYSVDMWEVDHGRI